MTFKAFAGNMYVGKLHVLGRVHSFYKAGHRKHTDLTFSLPCPTLLNYKRLTLRRVL